MPNPILDALGKVNEPKIDFSNPMATLNQMAQFNPRVRPIINAINTGGNPKLIFEEMCKQRGINPQDFLKSLNQYLGNNKF